MIESDKLQEIKATIEAQPDEPGIVRVRKAKLLELVDSHLTAIKTYEQSEDLRAQLNRYVLDDLQQLLRALHMELTGAEAAESTHALMQRCITNAAALYDRAHNESPPA